MTLKTRRVSMPVVANVEPLERRQLLSITIDPLTNAPVRINPSFGQLPAAYFRYDTPAAKDDYVGPYRNALLDIGDGDYSGTVLKLWGRAPNVDRAYLVYDGNKPRPATLVDVPGPTFEIRVDHLSVEGGMRRTQVALFNDAGDDYLLDGPKLIQSHQTILPLEPARSLAESWHEGQLYVPGIRNRDATRDSHYRLGISWDDGSATRWMDLHAYGYTSAAVAFNSVPIVHDLTRSHAGQLRLERTTGSRASVSMPFEIRTDSLPDPSLPQASTPPSKLPYVFLRDGMLTRPIDGPITRLDQVESLSPLPKATTVSIQWADGPTVPANLLPMGTFVGDGSAPPRWRYTVEFPKHSLPAGDSSAVVRFSFDGAERAMDVRIKGIRRGLTTDRPDGLWHTNVAEGFESDYLAGAFYDTAAVNDSAYRVRLKLDDGREFPGVVESWSRYAKAVYVHVPATWNENGHPASEWRELSSPLGTITIERPGASVTMAESFDLNADGWIASDRIDPTFIGLPPTLDLAGGGTAVFNGYRGRFDVPLAVGFDIDPDDIEVKIQWDRKHTSTPKVTRNAEGEYVIHAVHRYKRFGTYQPTIDVRYGDASDETERTVYVGDRGAGSSLLLTDNPKITTFAGVDLAREGIWHGSMQFIDTERFGNSGPEYLAQIRFDDGTPAPAVALKESNFGAAYRVEFAANFDEPGEHPFTAYVWTDIGEPLTTRGVVEVLPRSAYQEDILQKTHVFRTPVKLPKRRTRAGSELSL